jgi:hypothetical protein
MGKKKKVRIAEKAVFKTIPKELADEILKVALDWRDRRLSIALQAEIEEKTEWANSVGPILRTIIMRVLNFESVGGESEGGIIHILEDTRVMDPLRQPTEAILTLMRECRYRIVRGVTVLFFSHPDKCAWIREFVSQARQIHPCFEFHAVAIRTREAGYYLRNELGDITTSIRSAAETPPPEESKSHQIHLGGLYSAIYADRQRVPDVLQRIQQSSQRVELLLICDGYEWLTHAVLELILYIMHIQTLEKISFLFEPIAKPRTVCSMKTPKWMEGVEPRIAPLSFRISFPRKAQSTKVIGSAFRALFGPILELVPVRSFTFRWGEMTHRYQIFESSVYEVARHIYDLVDIEASHIIHSEFMSCFDKDSRAALRCYLTLPPDIQVMEFLRPDNLTSLDVHLDLDGEWTNSNLAYLCRVITYNKKLEELSLRIKDHTDITTPCGTVNVGSIYEAILDVRRAPLLRIVKVSFMCDTTCARSDFDTVCKLLAAKESIRSFVMDLAETTSQEYLPGSAEALVNLFESNKTLKEFYGFRICPSQYSLCEMDDILTAFEFNQIMLIAILETRCKDVKSDLYHFRYLKALFKHYENDVRLTKLAWLSGILRYVKSKRHLYDRCLIQSILEFTT